MMKVRLTLSREGTLYKIGVIVETNWRILQILNGIENPHLIYVGQVTKVPPKNLIELMSLVTEVNSMFSNRWAVLDALSFVSKTPTFEKFKAYNRDVAVDSAVAMTLNYFYPYLGVAYLAVKLVYNKITEWIEPEKE